MLDGAAVSYLNGIQAKLCKMAKVAKVGDGHKVYKGNPDNAAAGSKHLYGGSSHESKAAHNVHHPHKAHTR